MPKRKTSNGSGCSHKKEIKRQKSGQIAAEEGNSQASDSKSSDSKQSMKAKSACLSAFMKSYKGTEDWHLPIFEAVQKFTGARRVIYPGCHRHVSPSLVFPDVLYVDCDAKVAGVYTDEAVINWVHANKRYAEDNAEIKFEMRNFESLKLAQPGSFDLLISACAGIVSDSCKKYVKKGGHLLISDAHFDARKASLDPNLSLVGVWEESELKTDEVSLKDCFNTTGGTKITKDQVKESIEKPKNKLKFKFVKELMFYLFVKNK